MKYAVLLAIVSVLLGVPVGAEEPETWVQVSGGAFVIRPKELDRVQASLESQVAGAAKAQGAKLPPWRKYLVQYRATYSKGKRAIEIHGSCWHEAQDDIRKAFIGNDLMDGGICYWGEKIGISVGPRWVRSKSGSCRA